MVFAGAGGDPGARGLLFTRIRVERIRVWRIPLERGRGDSFREDSCRGDSRKSASAPGQRESQPSNPLAIVIVDLIIYIYIE